MYGEDFDALFTKLTSSVPDGLTSAAASWRGFAKACQISAAKAGRAADTVSTHRTAPYQAAGDRANPIAQQVSALGSRATAMADKLSRAGEAAGRARYEAFSQKIKVDKTINQVSALADGRGDTNINDDGRATASTNAHERVAIQQAKEAAAAVLRKESANVTAVYNSFGTDGGAGSGSAGGGGAGAPSGGNSVAPSSSAIAGTDAGDFAGWIRDPRTGQLVDPATGQVYDPQTSRYIDPLTGRPFGEVERYASRLEGLSGGAPLSGGGAPLFGGAVPPSLSPVNPAADQLRAQANQQLAANAAAAQQFAANTQRPPYPPPGGGVAGGGAPRASRPHRTPVSAPRSIWGGHPASARNQTDKHDAPQPSHWATDDETWSSGTHIPNLLDDDTGK